MVRGANKAGAAFSSCETGRVLFDRIPSDLACRPCLDLGKDQVDKDESVFPTLQAVPVFKMTPAPWRDHPNQKRDGVRWISS